MWSYWIKKTAAVAADGLVTRSATRHRSGCCCYYYCCYGHCCHRRRRSGQTGMIPRHRVLRHHHHRCRRSAAGEERVMRMAASGCHYTDSDTLSQSCPYCSDDSGSWFWAGCSLSDDDWPCHPVHWPSLHSRLAVAVTVVEAPAHQTVGKKRRKQTEEWGERRCMGKQRLLPVAYVIC